MTRVLVAAMPLAAVLALISSGAQSTGLDRLHAQARVGGKVCMTEHEHYGEGTMASRRGAELAAMRAWSRFTAFEYGSQWGSYRAAAGKKLDCSQAGRSWVCKTWARPCRPAR